MNGYKDIGAAELQAMLAQGSIRLVDVRTEAEIAKGFIPGAEKLPLHLLPMQLGQMDRYAPIVFYCQIGGRSAQAAAFAAAQGFTEIYNLQGGIGAWMRNGGAVSI